MADPRYSVCVVDDDASIRRSLVRLIKLAGYDAEGFESANAYVKRALVTAPDCLVLDIRLPGTNGLELQERLKGTRLERPTVLITGHGDEDVRRQGLELGAVEVLFKPVRESRLLDAIARALAGRPPH